jgi:hypothetical protein
VVDCDEIDAYLRLPKLTPSIVEWKWASPLWFKRKAGRLTGTSGSRVDRDWWDRLARVGDKDVKVSSDGAFSARYNDSCERVKAESSSREEEIRSSMIPAEG